MVRHFAQDRLLSFRVHILVQVAQGRVVRNIELSPYHLHGAFVVVLSILPDIQQVLGNVLARRQPIVLCMLVSMMLEALFKKTGSGQLRKFPSLSGPSVLFKRELLYTKNFDLYNPYVLFCRYLLRARGPHRRNREALGERRRHRLGQCCSVRGPFPIATFRPWAKLVGLAVSTEVRSARVRFTAPRRVT